MYELLSMQLPALFLAVVYFNPQFSAARPKCPLFVAERVSGLIPDRGGRFSEGGDE